MWQQKYSIFIVAGRNTKAQNYIKSILTAFGIDIISMEEARKEAFEHFIREPALSDIVLTGMKKANEVFILYTPDEFVSTKKEFRYPSEVEAILLTQPRPNIILELGMALALSQKRQLNKPITIIDAHARIPSDIDYRLRVIWGDDLIDHLYNRLKQNFHGIKKLDNAAISHLMQSNPLSTQIDEAIMRRVNNADGCSLVLKSRGTFKEFSEYFEQSNSICILGAINHTFMRLITSNPTCCKNKNIKVLFPSNCLISGNFDILEHHSGRVLIEQIRKSSSNFYEVKNQYKSDMQNVTLKFYDYFISSSIYIFDDIIWLTPYGTIGADESPSFLVCKSECPEAYKHYKDMYIHIWEKSNISLKCNENCNNCVYRHTLSTSTQA